MGSKIFQTILTRKIDGFASTFIEDSESIFFEEGKLIHPGEYGKYRENALCDLIKLITSHKVADGFIFTSKNNTSTQLDIVIYNKEEVPLLETGNVNFFTIESVLAIGEVKSNMSKAEFVKALQKLAVNKKLNSERVGTNTFKSGNRTESDELISFLVCKKMNFDYNNLNLNEVYNGIERKYWHNFVLSLEDGLMGYEFKNQNLSKANKAIFEKSGGNLDSTIWYEYPIYTFNNEVYEASEVFHKIEKKFYHIELFITKLAATLKYKSLFSTDFLEYMELPKAPVFK
jgi:hypothetical protein